MPFKVQIIVATETVTLTKRFDYDDTIRSIKQEYYDNENNSRQVSQMNLFYNGQPMTDNKTIEYYEDDVERSFRCMLQYRLNGGSYESKDESKESFNNKSYKIGFMIPNRKRILSQKSIKKLKTTKKACCIYGDCPTLNVKMSCGCILCPDAIFKQIHETFASDKNIAKVLCPNCKKEWSFKEYQRAGCLYDDEYDVISLEIQKRLAPECKNCPNCGSPNSKPDDLKMSRVACQCNKGDWCWFCAKKWAGSGFIFCGNTQCVSNDINITLEKCPTKDLGKDYGNVIVPIFRACPKCYQLIRHETACKHMTCVKCKHNFCFSCLAAKNSDGTWPCKEYYDKCPAAKRQTLK